MALLKIGELAKRAGMSVRMLRHYDGIGLLSPSARTEADYRLYDQDDVARLLAIQALRQIGLSLKDISALLAGKTEPLPVVIQRQITALEYQVRQASELCSRLKLVQSSLNKGYEPDMQDWLAMLQSMSMYGKYFSASELKKIFEGGRQTEERWRPLVADIRKAMQRGLPPASLEVQPLARRWMDLSVLMTHGDYDLMKRWEKMYLHEPSARGKQGDSLELVLYINQAIDIRLKALRKYFTQRELEILSLGLEDEWIALANKLKKLVKASAATKSKNSAKAVDKWRGLIAETTNHDAALSKKFIEAFGRDEILQAGSILGPESEKFIRSAWAQYQNKGSSDGKSKRRSAASTA
ncbi:MAG: MerR family transcriptional regulator [Burkholderiales bacterium]|nr:MerR family transcriptional regulator [Burkholderiales bacterium]